MAKRASSTFAPLCPERPEHVNPLRELLVRLPLLKTSAGGALNLPGSPGTVVLEVAEHAEATAQALNLGLAALGNLWALASAEIEDGTVPMDCVESLGWLIAMLSECAASLMVLAVECRRA